MHKIIIGLTTATSLTLAGCISIDVGTSGSSAAGTAGCKIASFMPTPSSEMGVGIGYKSLGGTSLVQPFIPDIPAPQPSERPTPATSVTVQLQLVGNFSAASQTITATIEENTTHDLVLGTPSGNPIATSYALDPARITDKGPNYYTFRLQAPVELLPTQIYWLRLRASYSVNQTNYVEWSSYEGYKNGYIFDSISLGAMYETSQSTNSFSSAEIGQYRYLIFKIGC